MTRPSGELAAAVGRALDAHVVATATVPGWEDRIALHQIAPLVVHAIKFGGSYVGAATAAIARYA